MRKLLAGLVALALVAAAGWWFFLRDDGPTLQETPVQEQFFNQLGSLDPSSQRAALTLTQQGSPARRYVRFQLALGQARTDDGASLAASEVAQRTAGWDLCGTDGAGTAGTGQCNKFTRIRESADRIRTFRVDGDDIGDNLALGRSKRIEAGRAGAVEFVASYRQPSTRLLWVVFRVHTAGEPVALRLGKAGFTHPGGQALATSPVTTTGRIPARKSFTVALAVPGGREGGTVQLHLGVAGAVLNVALPVGAAGRA